MKVGEPGFNDCSLYGCVCPKAKQRCTVMHVPKSPCEFTNLKVGTPHLHAGCICTLTWPACVFCDGNTYHKDSIENQVVPDCCADTVTNCEMTGVSILLVERQKSELDCKAIPVSNPPPSDQEWRRCPLHAQKRSVIYTSELKS